MKIVLASASPRRKELLEQVKCPFVTEVSEIEEDNEQALPPEEIALGHALAKARDIAGRNPAGTVVIGADTIVVLDGKVFGKPADAAEARLMLEKLSGRSHQVMTGVAVVKDDAVFAACPVTKVYMKQLSATQIAAYVASEEPLDKAGAYGIQGLGALLVEKIDGCYFNVVGLPLQTVATLLQEAGVELL